jgi:hypothetical protein
MHVTTPPGPDLDGSLHVPGEMAWCRLHRTRPTFWLDGRDRSTVPW